MTMTGACIEVPPLKRREIRKVAQDLRDSLCIDQPFFPIMEVLEFALPNIFPDFALVIETSEDMGQNHGLTYPDKGVIKLRDDVYINACNNKGRDRLTAAHELGHLLLHREIALPRKASPEDIEPFRDSEWQASCFGGELLMSYLHVNKCKDSKDASRLFAVSPEAAEYQWRKFKEDRIIRG
jgi:hypothetical protein